MQTAAINNLFLIDLSSFKLSSGLHKVEPAGRILPANISRAYKRRLYKEAITRLGDRLIARAHHAYTLRQMDIVEQASRILINFPLVSPISEHRADTIRRYI